MCLSAYCPVLTCGCSSCVCGFQIFYFCGSRYKFNGFCEKNTWYDTSDQTKIQKKARSKIARKRNENTTLIENLTTEAVSSSQAEVEFCQNEYEQRKVVEDE